jgi:hypothetical protein
MKSEPCKCEGMDDEDVEDDILDCEESLGTADGIFLAYIGGQIMKALRCIVLFHLQQGNGWRV